MVYQGCRVSVETRVSQESLEFLVNPEYLLQENKETEEMWD
jgi:hypothetical protein